MSLFTGAIATAIGLGLGATGQVIGAKAANHAADTQAKAAQEALDFAKAQKAKQEAAYAPFGALGQQAVGMLPGLARQAPTQGPPAPYTTQPRATAPMPQANAQGAPMSMMGGPPQGMPAQMPQQPQGGGMVVIQAPDGTRRPVPSSAVPYYTSPAKGGKVVG